jgi:hypothetical protein
MRRTHASFFFVLLGVFVITTSLYAGTLVCTATTTVGCSAGTIILRLNSDTNAHAELPSQSNIAYGNTVLCCSGVTGLSNSCSAVQATVLKLSSLTNSHVQQNDQTGYTNNACISVASGGYVAVGYQNTTCTGFDTVIGSISSADNAHAGTSTAYTLKVCGSASNVAPLQSISFNLSTNLAYFGDLVSTGARYASSTDAGGSSSEVEAHTFSVGTNAVSGYNVYVQGQTLTSLQNSANTINAIGGTNTGSIVGTEQFGLRIATTTGTGLVTTPYDGSGFAYAATATTSSQVASGAGDSVITTFSVRYLTNIAGISKSGSYVANLVYVAVANF